VLPAARPSGSFCESQIQISTPAAIKRRPRKIPKKEGENTTQQHELLEELALRPLATPPPQAPRSRAARSGAGTGLAVLLFLRLPHPPQQARRPPAARAAAARP
jgi:hypothetical protein